MAPRVDGLEFTCIRMVRVRVCVYMRTQWLRIDTYIYDQIFRLATRTKLTAKRNRDHSISFSKCDKDSSSNYNNNDDTDTR